MPLRRHRHSAHTFAALAIALSAADELAAQSQWGSTSLMWPRAYAAAAGDPVTGELRIFGGNAGNDSFGDVWSRGVSAHWQLAGTTPFNGDLQIAYDPAAGRFLAVAESHGFAVWDRTSWTFQAQPQVLINGRWLLARDPGRQVTTLVVSAPAGVEVHDWNGTSWTRRASTGVPPPWNINGRLVHDPATGALLSLTSFPPGTPLQVWSCNGTSWQQIVTPTSPPPLEWFGTARDPLTGELLVFGGYQSIGGFAVTQNQLWAFNGSSWRLRPSPTAPAARSAPAMTNSPTTGDVLVYGGASFQNNAAQFFGDLWSWNGNSWTQLAAADAPAIPWEQRLTAPAAFDRPHGTLLAYPLDAAGTAQLFDDNGWHTMPCGGSCPQAPVYLAYDELLRLPVAIGSNGAFLWSNGWAQVTFAGPTLPLNAALASDGQRLILFGGVQGTTATNTTLAWDISGWTQLSPAHSPPPSAGHAMASMPSRGEIVLLTNNRTWTWNRTDWIDRGPVPWPARFAGALAYLPERDRVVLHGGIELSIPGNPLVADTYEWNGTNWQLMPPTNAPQTANHRLVEGPGDSLLILPESPLAMRTYRSVTPSTVVGYGQGCLGSVGVPELFAPVWQRPRLGTQYDVQLQSAPTQGAFLAIGFRDDVWAGQPLPASLAAVGMPNCSALLAVDSMLPAPTPGGRATWALAIPNQPAILGLQFYLQAVAVDAAANAFGATVSNGLKNRIGQR